MTYEAFKTEYEKLLAKFLSYEAKTIGSNEYASKLADLCEAYPEFEERYDNEQ
jgi:hypothetical protein